MLLDFPELMPPLASVPEFIDALHASQVLEPAQLEDTIQNLQSQCDTPAALADTLVQRKWLTPYQVEQVVKGRGHDLVLGPYRLLDLLGEGGMGQVFRAKHQRLHRIVALKVIRGERLSADPEVVRRFQREAQLAAQMSHPNVVLVFDADQIDDRHFIAMEYVEGIDLSKLVRERGPLPVRHACEFIRQAALGLQHAHERGLVHRDIKPSNLFVTRVVSRPDADKDEAAVFGVLSESVIKILDMGLARLTETTGQESSSFHTQVGTVMGTPDFIAPEQARNASAVDHRADLYSLGGTFYFLLTGRPPFEEGSVVEKLLMHQLDDPKPVEELRPHVPARVLAVVRKLMAKRPADRYQTAQEVADELGSLAVSDSGEMIGKPISDSSGTIVKPALAAATATAPTESTAVVHVSPMSAMVARADPVAPPERPRPKSVDVPEPAKRIASFKGHRGWVISAAFSPDRRLLASGGVDGSIRLWGFSSSVPEQQLLPEAHDGEVNALAFAPNGQLLASGGGNLDGVIWLWDLSDASKPKIKAVFKGHQAPVSALDFSPDGMPGAPLFASASQDKTVRLWDATGAHAEPRCVMKGHEDTVQAVKFSPDGKLVASGGQDGTIRLWSSSKRWWSSEEAVLRGHAGAVKTIAFSPDGHTLASGGIDQTIRIWDLSEGQARPLAVLRGQDDVLRLLQFSPDGATLTSIGNRGHVILWDLVSGAKQREWPFRLIASSIAFTFDGRYMAAGKTDSSIDVFRLYPRSTETKSSPE